MLDITCKCSFSATEILSVESRNSHVVGSPRNHCCSDNFSSCMKLFLLAFLINIAGVVLFPGPTPLFAWQLDDLASHR